MAISMMRRLKRERGEFKRKEKKKKEKKANYFLKTKKHCFHSWIFKPRLHITNITNQSGNLSLSVRSFYRLNSQQIFMETEP